MRKTIDAQEMIDLLTKEWKYTYGFIKDYGADDPRAQMHVSWCIGMKEMTEALICAPVNLRRDGTVYIGLD